MGKAARRRRARDRVNEGVAPDAPVDLDAELAKLPPEQLELFTRALALSMKKRRLMLGGYLGALVAVVGGQIGALIYWANREPGSFVAWVFLLPLALAGVILVATARAVRRLKPPG